MIYNHDWDEILVPNLNFILIQLISLWKRKQYEAAAVNFEIYLKFIKYFFNNYNFPQNLYYNQ